MDTAASRLNLIGLGRTDSPYRKVKLISTDAYLVSTVSNYPHPWWDVAGRLWSDTLIGQDPDAWLRLNLSTANDANFGRVLSYDFTALDNIEFQHHQRRMNATNYFAGDGRVNDLPQGESYIHLMKAVPGAAVEQYRLAKAVGTEDLNNTGYPANARLTEHPFKHGNRVTVTGASTWRMDYSSRTNWGDDVNDTSQRGGENSIDTPGVEDVSGDGYAGDGTLFSLR